MKTKRTRVATKKKLDFVLSGFIVPCNAELHRREYFLISIFFTITFCRNFKKAMQTMKGICVV